MILMNIKLKHLGGFQCIPRPLRHQLHFYFHKSSGDCELNTNEGDETLRELGQNDEGNRYCISREISLSDVIYIFNQFVVLASSSS